MDNKKKIKLTKKQRIFVAEYAKDENGTQAAIKAYDVKDATVAASVATENLRKPYITEAIEVKRISLKQALINRGIDEDYIAEKVDILLTAQDENGKKDFTAIDKGLKHATTIYGVIDPSEKPQQVNTYNFLFSAETQADVRDLEDKIKMRLLQKHEPTKES